MSTRWAARSPRTAERSSTREISVHRKPDEGVAARPITEWKQKFGSGRRGEPVALWQGMDVEALGLALEKSEFPDLRIVAEALIRPVFGVPPILVGAEVGHFLDWPVGLAEITSRVVAGR